MSVESWRTVFEFASIIAGVVALVAAAITVIALIGISICDRKIKANQLRADRAKDERIRVLEREVETANNAASEAQNRIAWRLFDEYTLRDVLTKGVKGAAEILYKPEDEEAYAFANEIWSSLVFSGWSAEQPKPGRASDSSMPFALREGGTMITNTANFCVLVSSDEEVVAKPYSGNTAVNALMRAFDSAGFAPQILKPHEGIRPAAGLIKIVVSGRL